MTCQQCQDAGGVYNVKCPYCVARFCLTLPKESGKATEELLCRQNGHDIEQVRRIAQRIKEERFQKAIREGLCTA